MFLSREIYNFLKHVPNSSKVIFLRKNFYTSANYAGQVSFKLSDIGEGIREVTVKEWFVKVGDRVSQFDEICEVQSDKASVTITSRYDGIIKKLHHKIDEIALVGQPLVDIETKGDEGDETPFEETKEQNEKIIVAEEKKQSDTDKTNSEILCIPSVRRLAKEHKIDLSQIKGTGKDNRILKEDVLKYLQSTNDTSEDTVQPKLLQNDRTVPLTPFQKVMVKTMTDALKIPHFVYGDEIIVTQLSQLRQNLKKQDLKLSFMPFFIKAASNSLQRFPLLNSTVDQNLQSVTYKTSHNIGIAMDTKIGLAVPVIKNVEKLSIIEINNELNRLMKNGRDGVFSPQDLTGGTFTISNIGAIGGTYMSPVITPPQVAIIALGATQVLPRFDHTQNIVPVEVINLSGAADHRIVDGATMARFVQVVKRQIENPYLLFLDV